VIAMEHDAPPMDIEGLRRQLSGKISAYKLPRSMECVDEIRRTDAGKVRRKSFRSIQ
jgi:acyl-CoA synthetase (AMP-forming)/AMP-acid ligase II